MDLENFFQKEKNIKNIYYIYAENNYILNSFKKHFLEKYVDKEIRDFNLSYVNSGEDYFKRLSAAVNTPPIGSSKRFVISALENDFTLNKKESSSFAQITGNIDKSTILLFLSSHKLDKRKKFYKTINEKGIYQEFKTPKYKNLDKWIYKKFREHNKKVDKTAVKFLENMFSNRLEILDSEIKKLITRYPDKDKISIYDIKKIISRDKFIEDEEIFNFLDLLGEKKIDKAFLSLKNMLNKGVYPLYLLTMMTNQIELLMQVKYQSKFTTNHRKIAKKLNKHRYPVKKALKRSRNFTQFELENILEEIMEANYRFLSGYYPEQNMALEMIIIKSISL